MSSSTTAIVGSARSTDTSGESKLSSGLKKRETSARTNAAASDEINAAIALSTVAPKAVQNPGSPRSAVSARRVATGSGRINSLSAAIAAKYHAISTIAITAIG